MKLLQNLAIAILAVLAPIKAVLLTTMVLVASDLVLGVIAAHKRKEKITSQGLRRTAAKLFVYEMAIMLGFLAETYLIGPIAPVSKVISAFIGLTELKSIVENLNDISGQSVFKVLINKISNQEAIKDENEKN